MSFDARETLPMGDIPDARYAFGIGGEEEFPFGIKGDRKHLLVR